MTKKSKNTFEHKMNSVEFMKYLHTMIDFFVTPYDEVLDGKINFKFDEDLNKIISMKLKVGLKKEDMK